MFRLRFISLVMLAGFLVPSVSGQAVLPREPDKLMSRVQQYWDALKTNRQNTALQLVLSEDRDAFLAGGSTQIKDVQVTGWDFTGDRNKAIVRVTVTQLPPGAADFMHIPVTDQWVWQNNNWYLHVPDPKERDSIVGKFIGAEAKKYQKEFEESLALESDVFDAGVLLRGPIATLKVPLNYSGKWGLNVESLAPATFVYTRERDMAPRTGSFPLYVLTQDASDEFNIPLHLRFWSGIAFVEKILTVKGKIFSPIVVRGPAGVIVPGRPVSLFVKNNTDESVEATYSIPNEEFSFVSGPSTIAPHAEVEVVLELLSGRKPENVTVELRKPLNGLFQFPYRFSTAR